jgi:phage FluMu protein Com
MSVYMRPPAMQTGIGFTCFANCGEQEEVQLRCPNCNNVLIGKMGTGQITLHFDCSRCKATLHLSIKKFNGKRKVRKNGISVKVRNEYNIALECNRCKSYMEVRVREALPWVKRTDPNGATA